MDNTYTIWILLLSLSSFCFTATLGSIHDSVRGLKSTTGDSIQLASQGTRFEQPMYQCTLHRQNEDAVICYGALIAPQLVMTAAHCVDSEQGDSAATQPIVKCNTDIKSSLHTPKIYKGIKVQRVWVRATSETEDYTVAFVKLDHEAKGPFAVLDEGDLSSSKAFYLIDEKDLIAATSPPSSGSNEGSSKNLDGAAINCGILAKEELTFNDYSTDSNTCGLVTRCRIYEDGIRRCIVMRVLKTWRQYRCLVQDSCGVPPAPTTSPSKTPSVEPSDLPATKTSPSPTSSPSPGSPSKGDAQSTETRGAAVKSSSLSKDPVKAHLPPKPPKQHFPPCPKDLTPFRLRSITETLRRIRRQMMFDKFRTVRTNFCIDFSPNTRDDHMDTPLHYAARYNANYSAWVVLVLGADTELKNADGQTALEIATAYHSVKTLDVLNKYDASTEVTTKYGLTPLMNCTMYDDQFMAKILIEYGAKVDAQDTKFGNTPLHFAAEKGYLEMTKILVNAGASLDIKNKNDETPADVVCKDSSSSCSDSTLSDFNKILNRSIT